MSDTRDKFHNEVCIPGGGSCKCPADLDGERETEGVVLSGAWPGEVMLEGIVDESVLTDEQEARVSAVYHARSALERRGAVLLGGGKDSSIPPSPADLIRVAKFILEGE